MDGTVFQCLNIHLKIDSSPTYTVAEGVMAEPASEKSVYVIRHGRSEHNEVELDHVRKHGKGVPMSDPLCYDARLSATGEEEAKALRSHVESIGLHDADLVVVSPLTRAIQTCLYAFNPEKVKILVSAMAREKVENACDLGRPPAELKKDFPNLDFSNLSDIWWYVPEGMTVTPEDYRQRWISERYEEPIELLRQRVESFKEWLRSRPEKKIVVVGHSNFFLMLTGMSEKLKNCEVKKIDI